MGDRSIKIIDIPLKPKPTLEGKLDSPTHVRVEVFYGAGGMCYFTGQNNARGYSASARSVTIKEGCVSFILLAGTKTFLEPANRFNAKRLKVLADGFKANPMYQKIVDYVLSKENLEIAVEVQAPAVV